MECLPKHPIYHRQTIIDEDGVVITKEEIDQLAYKTLRVHTERKTDSQGQTHVYTVRVIKKHGVQLKLF